MPKLKGPLERPLRKRGLFPTGAVFSIRLPMRVKKTRKPSWDMTLGYRGHCEGGRGQSLCSAIPLPCYSQNMTMMAYIKSHGTHNLLLHAIPKQSQSKTRPCASQLCRGKAGGGTGRGRGGSEPGFTVNADWHQGATWGPRAFLRPWPAARRAAALQAGVTWHPGGNNVF